MGIGGGSGGLDALKGEGYSCWKSNNVVWLLVVGFDDNFVRKMILRPLEATVRISQSLLVMGLNIWIKKVRFHFCLHSVVSLWCFR